MFRRTVVVLVACITVAGTSYAEPLPGILIVKDESSVANCQFLGEVKGSSASAA